MVRAAGRVNGSRMKVRIAKRRQIALTERWRGDAVALTATEFDILAALARDPGVVISRGQLVDRVWRPEFASWIWSGMGRGPYHAARSR
jgi:DNA-binding response OmpR family regulator